MKHSNFIDACFSQSEMNERRAISSEFGDGMQVVWYLNIFIARKDENNEVYASIIEKNDATSVGNGESPNTSSKLMRMGSNTLITSHNRTRCCESSDSDFLP